MNGYLGLPDKYFEAPQPEEYGMPHSPQYIRAFFKYKDEKEKAEAEKKKEEEKKEEEEKKKEKKGEDEEGRIDPNWAAKGIDFPTGNLPRPSHDEKLVLYKALHGGSPVLPRCGLFEYELLSESNLEILQQHFGTCTEKALNLYCKNVSSLMGHGYTGEIRFYLKFHPGKATRVTGSLDWQVSRKYDAGFMNRFRLAEAALIAYRHSIITGKKEDMYSFISEWYVTLGEREYNAAYNKLRMKEISIEQLAKARRSQAGTMAGGSSHGNMELVKRQAEWAKPVAALKMKSVIANCNDVQAKALVLSNIVNTGNDMDWVVLTRLDRQEAAMPIAEDLFTELVQDLVHENKSAGPLVFLFNDYLLNLQLIWDNLVPLGVRYRIINEALVKVKERLTEKGRTLVDKRLKVWASIAGELETPTVEEKEGKGEGEEEKKEEEGGKGEASESLASKLASTKLD